MFESLYDWLNELPFEEQKLFLEIHEELMDDYEGYKLLGRKEALEELRRVVVALKSDIYNNKRKVK